MVEWDKELRVNRGWDEQFTTPAGDVAIEPQTARERFADGHCGESPFWWDRLAVIVSAPTQDPPVGTYTARMFCSGRDRYELASWWGSLTSPVMTPAGQRAAGPYPAGVLSAGGKGGERSRRRGDVPVLLTPAGDGLIGSQRARVVSAGCDAGEFSFRRVGLTSPVGTPASNRLIGSQSTCVGPASCYGRIRTLRGVCLACPVLSPASDGCIGVQSAREPVTGADGDKFALCLALVVLGLPPAGDRPVPAHSAGMGPTCGKGGELTFSGTGTVIRALSPAHTDTIETQSARLTVSGGDSRVLSRGRIGLTLIVVTPAGDCAIGAYPTGMGTADSNRQKTPSRRQVIAIPVGAPAYYQTVGAKST